MSKVNPQEIAYLIFNAHDYPCIQKLKRILTYDTELLNSLSKEIKESIEYVVYENDKLEFAAFGAENPRWRLF